MVPGNRVFWVFLGVFVLVFFPFMLLVLNLGQVQVLVPFLILVLVLFLVPVLVLVPVLLLVLFSSWC